MTVLVTRTHKWAHDPLPRDAPDVAVVDRLVEVLREDYPFTWREVADRVGGVPLRRVRALHPRAVERLVTERTGGCARVQA